MKVKYAERGTFDAKKAAKGLLELNNKMKKQRPKDQIKNDKIN
ncbi:hypothetical protein [Bacillus sp. MUM 116]|nr:hypothetical protein [Bacillus sp. MUM 116]